MTKVLSTPAALCRSADARATDAMDRMVAPGRKKEESWWTAEKPVLHSNSMDLDPHTLQQIIQRIYQQMRCPQCSKRVPVDFSSVRLAADDFLLLQLKCDTCDAYIVLHASLQGADKIQTPATKKVGMVNASSALHLNEDEITQLREALDQCSGSFEKLFNKYGDESIEDEEVPTDIA